MGTGPVKPSLPVVAKSLRPVAAAHAAVGGLHPLHFPTLQHLASYLGQVPSSETVLLPASGPMGVVYPLGTVSTSSGVAVSALEGFKFPLGSAQPVGVPTPQVQLSCSYVLGSHMASKESLGAPYPKVPTTFQYATPLP